MSDGRLMAQQAAAWRRMVQLARDTRDWAPACGLKNTIIAKAQVMLKSLEDQDG